jgi:hypothetical protein
MQRTFLILFLLAASSNLFGQSSVRLAQDADLIQLSKRARRAEAKGERIDIPLAILTKIRANTSDCQIGGTDETDLFDTYRVSMRDKDDSIVVIWGRGSCYCSPTGNCAFWIFHPSPNGYRPFLQTDMVRDFGFLTSTNHSLRDFVAWSHGSAELSPARLYRFDGSGYREVCGWDEHTKYREGPDRAWIAGKTTIEQNGCAEADLRSE